ncbi:hypothetical protein IW262DRAFT_1453490 [Armillaria fumosa]|nr:hypothetical protein IW262DRAFT_1453490 [Armillaria fumosa]
MAIRIRTDDIEFTLCNAYNIPDSDKTIGKLQPFLNSQDEEDILVLLLASDTEDFLQLLAESGLELVLPPGTPTFTSVAHKTMSTIDLAFATRDMLVPSVIWCDAVLWESSWHHMLRVDLDLQLVHNPPKSRPLFQEADWETFWSKLHTHFEQQPLNLNNITTAAELDAEVDKLVDGTAEILMSVVPMSKPLKYSK